MSIQGPGLVWVRDGMITSSASFTRQACLCQLLQRVARCHPAQVTVYWGKSMAMLWACRNSSSSSPSLLMLVISIGWGEFLLSRSIFSLLC